MNSSSHLADVNEVVFTLLAGLCKCGIRPGGIMSELSSPPPTPLSPPTMT